MMQEMLGEQGAAAAVPPHVDDEPGGVAVLDEAEQPAAERRECLRRVVTDGVELEVDEVVGWQVLEPERQPAVAQVQRPGVVTGQAGSPTRQDTGPSETRQARPPAGPRPWSRRQRDGQHGRFPVPPGPPDSVRAP